VPDPPVVIIAGDFLAHDFPEHFASAEPSAPPKSYDRFVDNTIAFLAAEFAALYPAAQFAITIGNNDGFCGDYRSTPGSPFLRHEAEAWAPLVEHGTAPPRFVRDFSVGGYYAGWLPVASTQIVSLNGVPWSTWYENTCGAAGSDPGAAELDWLAATLKSSSPAHRLILLHIPPGMDEYSSMRANKPVPFMREQYVRRLLAIIAGDASASGIILGHMHHASFEIVGPGDGSGLPAIVVPSISAVQGNNPAFIAARLGGAGGAIADTTTYVLPLGASSVGWKAEYSFDSAYGLSAFDTPNLTKLQATLAADLNVRTAFNAYYNSESTTAMISPPTWPWYWCGHVNLYADAYASCVSKLVPTPSPSG
jgi:hypothetical protein